MSNATFSKPITLQQPVPRGSSPITEVQIRTPKAGELRGVQLSALLASDYDALRTVLPRITVPTINPPEIDEMDPADVVKLSGEVVGFLLPKEAKMPESPTE